MPLASAGFRFKGKWPKLKHIVDARRFEAALEENIKRATKFNGMMVAAEIRKRLKRRGLEKNALFTIILKRSTKPLVDEALLFQAITYRVINPRTVFVGVMRTSKSPSGEPIANIAEVVHEGATIKVTRKMRGLFYVLSQASNLKRDPSTLTGRAREIWDKMISSWGAPARIKPLKPSTSAIVIPKRPFIRRVFENKMILSKVKGNWERAIAGAIKGDASPELKGPTVRKKKPTGS